MSSYNYCCFIGNLTADPNLSYTPSGVPNCKFSIAVSNTYKDKTGQKINKPMFIDVTIWNKTAENVAQYCKKGKQVMVTGRLELQEWEDQQKQKRRKHALAALQVIFLGQNGTGTHTPSEPASAGAFDIPPAASADGTPPPPPDDNQDENIPF